MKLERTKNMARNVAYGYLSKIILMFFPFLTRSIFIRVLGAEYLGLNGLFSSILTVLNMTELGFASAIVVHMYRAIEADDHTGINALLSYYRKIYHGVGLVILAVGCALIPFLPKLINGSWPSDISLTAVYLVYLFDTCASYFLFAYYASLASAFQRDDLMIRVDLFTKILMYLGQIALLLTVRNYYAYLAILPLCTIGRNLCTYLCVRKTFPRYSPQGAISPQTRADILQKVKGAVIGRVSWVCRNSFDSVFISMFLGLTATAIYGNYYYIMNTLTALMQIFIKSVNAGAGNSIELETQAKNHRDMNCMNFLYMWLAGWCSICMLCLYQPFMTLWVGRDMLLPVSTMVLFCVYFYLLKMGDVLEIYATAKGLFWERRHIAIAEGIGNITLNYFLGKHFGIAGILWATILTVAGIGQLFGSRVVFRHYFTDYSVNRYLLRHLKYALITTAVGAVTYAVCSRVSLTGIPELLAIGTICAVLPNCLYLIILCRTGAFRDTRAWTLEKLKNLRKGGIKS